MIGGNNIISHMSCQCNLWELWYKKVRNKTWKQQNCITISNSTLILTFLKNYWYYIKRFLPMMEWSAYETNIKVAQMRHKNPKQYRWANASCRMPTM